MKRIEFVSGNQSNQLENIKKLLNSDVRPKEIKIVKKPTLSKIKSIYF